MIKSFPQALFVCVLVCNHASICKSSVLVQQNEKYFESQPLKHLSKLFVGCHFKFIFMNYKVSSPYVNEIWNQFDKLAVAMGDRVTISVIRTFKLKFSGRKRLNVMSHNTCQVPFTLKQSTETEKGFTTTTVISS